MIGLELSFQFLGKIFRCGFVVADQDDSNDEKSGITTEQKPGKAYQRESVGFTAKRRP